jgi:hypothetical protein
VVSCRIVVSERRDSAHLHTKRRRRRRLGYAARSSPRECLGVHRWAKAARRALAILVAVTSSAVCGSRIVIEPSHSPAQSFEPTRWQQRKCTPSTSRSHVMLKTGSASLTVTCERAQSRRRCGRREPSPGANVAAGEPSPGADVAGVSPVPAQMRQRVSPVPAQMRQA